MYRRWPLRQLAWLPLHCARRTPAPQTFSRIDLRLPHMWLLVCWPIPATLLALLSVASKVGLFETDPGTQNFWKKSQPRHFGEIRGKTVSTMGELALRHCGRLLRPSYPAHCLLPNSNVKPLVDNLAFWGAPFLEGTRSACRCPDGSPVSLLGWFSICSGTT